MTPVHIIVLSYVGGVVGLEQTFFRVSENVGVVELCAILLSFAETVIDCPITFAYEVSLSTYDGTAGIITSGWHGCPQHAIHFQSLQTHKLRRSM